MGTLRFIAGTFATHPGRDPLASWRPRGAHTAYAASAMRIWTTAYAPDEIRACGTVDGPGEVLTLGSCLATEQELTAARQAAERSEWAATTRLPGCYLSVVRTGQTLRIAGTRAGTITVYWLPVEGGVLWASAAAPLAAYRGAEADPAVLLSAFTLRGLDTIQASHFRTVRRVPPYHALVLEAEAGPRVESVPSSARPRSFATGAPLVRDAVSTAVTRRATSNALLSADLSGGIDSTTVTCLAVAHSPLLAVTYTDARMGEQDDVRYAERIAAGSDGIRHAWVYGTRDGVQHFDALDDPAVLPLTDTPALTLGLLAIKAAQLTPATAHGSRLHLTGRGGDNVLDALPTAVIDQYRAGHRLGAFRNIVRSARAQHTALWPLLREAIRTQRIAYPQALDTLASLLDRPGALHRPGWAPPSEALSWCGITAAAAWLTPTGRRLVAELVGATAASADPRTAPGALHERLALEYMGAGHASYDQIARQQWSLPIHAPLLDTPVVDACLAIPGYERSRPGDYKPLARAAFTGQVPDLLLQRRTKTAFTGSLYAGLRTNAPVLRRLLTGSALAQGGLLDAKRAVAALDGAARGEPAPLAALHTLIVTELWLATLPTARGIWWENTLADEHQEATR
ncbi:Asparagine synthase (plasmid) [Streptomyces sp. YIM 121038]|uniref:asparagine synthase-related protein n=1 Tax=Streptomyces sp. YIM 121038 TaxID=2136401 RepID=UPI00111022A0|nr:asparagine synthase-related protein [Streptomyces sp. YIM 121038]QCX82221.1 Asparagine synthase [Streptomyces sp. YIM 121038]